MRKEQAEYMYQYYSPISVYYMQPKYQKFRIGLQIEARGNSSIRRENE
jgi:hypothetical protein